ncbi:MAG TPA: hypothetical protein VKK31_29175 [Thermoanaerobaculia bacterium]|nr:hypothetical protein [Thermoanaerobaculia bacterium]
MLNGKTKARPVLEELRARLAAWSIEVPARARRFQALRTDLEQQVAAVLERWVLRLGDEELSSLRQQVERLGELAPVLLPLIRQAETLEKEILDLRSNAERSPDRDLASWLFERCVDWQSTLRRLGANVGRLAELDPDQEALERTEQKVRRHAEAMRRLEEARQLLARLGNKMEAAGLQADFPVLRQRLLDEGATPAWLAEVEKAAAPARSVVDLPPKAPPQTLRQVAPLLHDARRWTRTLQTGEESVAAVQERSKVAEAEWETWSDSQIQDLFHDAAGLLEDLRRTAAERRSEASALLGARRLQLAGACGPNAELDREIAELEASSAGEPQTYQEWIERAVEARRHLFDAASSRLVDLQERIEHRRHDLKETLGVLEKEPLSNRSAGEAARLRLELVDLPDPYEQNVEAIFESLGACDRITLELERLAAQVRADREALAAIRRSLLSRNQSLRQEVTRSGIEISDLTARIEALADAGPGTSLDDLRLGADSLDLELSAAEKDLVARCRAWIGERLSALRRRMALLGRAGRTAGELPGQLSGLLAGDPSPSPSQAAGAVLQVRGLDEETARQLEEMGLDLEARGHGLLGQLGSLPLGSLRPEVRRDASDLLCWLGERTWAAAPDPEESARRLLEGLERCDAFLAKLSQEDREAEGKAEALQRRLREFNENDLDRFCPGELVQRASALLAAIPTDPPSWAEMAVQIAAAEDLIGLLENHARRVLAARLERAIPDLERQALMTRDPAYARRLRALLDEVAARDGRWALPVGLTAQILMLAPETPLEEHR